VAWRRQSTRACGARSANAHATSAERTQEGALLAPRALLHPPTGPAAPPRRAACRATAGCRTASAAGDLLRRRWSQARVHTHPWSAHACSARARAHIWRRRPTRRRAGTDPPHPPAHMHGDKSETRF
jgi:hypothetical protein